MTTHDAAVMLPASSEIDRRLRQRLEDRKPGEVRTRPLPLIVVVCTRCGEEWDRLETETDFVCDDCLYPI